MTVNSGKDYGPIACGLAARDSLRAGAGLPIAQQDIGAFGFSGKYIAQRLLDKGQQGIPNVSRYL
jgi:glycine cleavage system aminomethyltransferase T